MDDPRRAVAGREHEPLAEAEPPAHGPDLMQVKGQETAKRALEINPSSVDAQIFLAGAVALAAVFIVRGGLITGSEARWSWRWWSTSRASGSPVRRT